MKKTATVTLLLLAGLILMTVPAVAEGQSQPVGQDEKLPCVSHKPEEKPECAAPPLPPHSIEGPGGIFVTPVAYLVNPGERGRPIGMPALGVTYAMLRDKDFFAATFSVTLVNRVELSYAFNNLQLGDLRRDIRRKTGLDADYSHVQLHHFNLRVNLVPEGAFEQTWMPAVTAGIHFKYNKHVDSLNHRLGGVLHMIGVDDNSGVDYTLVATKMITDLLPRPLLLTAGVRRTKACHIGLLGFSNHYSTQAELSFAQFITDRLMLVGEYRSKPDKLDEMPGLVEEEDDWWTLAFCYILNNSSTLSFGYFNPGAVLNEDVNNGWACRLMYEF